MWKDQFAGVNHRAVKEISVGALKKPVEFFQGDHLARGWAG